MLILLILFVFSIKLMADEYDDAFTEGKMSAESILNEYGTKDKINERISKPMTSDDTPMKTCGGGNVTFNAQLTSTSSSNFLEIFVAPGGGGGLSQVIVRLDTNLDQTLDATYTSPVNIEGICSNGVISCSPGTWNNCRYYKWIPNNNTGLELVQVDTNTEKLSGCYCINNSCGSQLVFNNLSHVLSDLGGAMVATIQKNNPKLTITNVKVQDTTISYYGQNSTVAGENIMNNNPLYLSGTTNPESLNSSNIDSYSMVERINQASDPNSPYSELVKGTKTYVENPVEQETCRIERGVYFTAQNTPVATLRETCSQIDLNICALDTEYICNQGGGGCINTVKNGVLTGFSPLPQMTTMIDKNNAAWQFTATGNGIEYVNQNTSGVLVSGSNVWWLIKREFVCDSMNSYDSTQGLNRAADVKNSVVNNGTTVNYNDGQLLSVDIHKSQNSGPCEMGCKVTVAAQNHQTTTRDSTWEYNRDTSELKTYYKSCVGGTCPVESGETLIQDCQCLNDFAKSASMMQTMGNASKDMICSQQ